MSKDKSMCIGCRDNFYNSGNNQLGVQECWSFKDAKVVTRYAIGWWTPQDRRSNFQKVTTLACHHEPGKRAFLQNIPATAK